MEFATNNLQENAAKRRKEDEQATEAQAAATGAADLADTACATQLHCSRSTAGSHDKLDFHGIAGVVCSHIFPALGLFLPMPTYEQHYYYDVLFMALLMVGCCVSMWAAEAGARRPPPQLHPYPIQFTPTIHPNHPPPSPTHPQARCDVRFIYLDLACRYVGRFTRLVAKAIQDGVLVPDAAKVHRIVCWGAQAGLGR